MTDGAKPTKKRLIKHGKEANPTENLTVPETPEPKKTEAQEYEDESPNYFAAKYRELEDLPNVGEATAKKLREYGFTTIKSLTLANIQDLMKCGMGEEAGLKLLTLVRKISGINFIRGDELAAMRENMKTLTTGVREFDELFGGPGGGIPTQSITEFYGEFGAGKSQICHQLCLTAQLPVEQHGLGGKVLYIDTENIFRTERILQMNERFKVPEPLYGIIVAEAYTSEHQIALVNEAAKVVQDEHVKLIIVDSLTSHFRSEYLGREMLAQRQQQLNLHMHKLLRMAITFDLAVVVTNQVQSDPQPFGQAIKPVGGHIVGHMSHTRIFLKKTYKQGDLHNTRIAKVMASPFFGEGEALYKITATGLEDVPQD